MIDRKEELVSSPVGAAAGSHAAMLAFAALVLGLVSFVNLLGAEKSVPAIVLAVMALKASRAPATRRRASIALALGLLHLATVAIVLLMFRDRLAEFLHLLHILG